MPKLSSAAWIAHDLGLATVIGGALFGRIAFDPSLQRIGDPKERDTVNDAAWGRFGPVTLAAHVAIAAPWVIGRAMLSGREVSGTARSLVRAKDALVGVSLVSCVASAIFGVLMSRRKGREPGPEEARAGGPDGHTNGEEREKVALDYATDAAGLVNLAANVGLVGVTALLAMEGSESLRFTRASRQLP